MKIKKFILPIALIFAVSCLVGCGNQDDNNKGTPPPVNQTELDEFIANFDKSNPFVDNQIIIVLTEEASFKNIFHDYTVEDFPGIGAVEVKEIDGSTSNSDGLTYRIRQYLTEDPSGNTLPDHLKRFNRSFCITLDKNDYDNVLRAVYVMLLRTDVELAGPNSISTGGV